MIYLKPIGGLCNRMRTIDSMISICKIKKYDLTILWVNDASLNCSFEEVFEIPHFKEFNFKVITCPVGYPEKFVKSPWKLTNGKREGNSQVKYYKQKLKNGLQGRSLTKELSIIKNDLEIIQESNILTNEELGLLYSSSNKKDSKSVDDMDEMFIPNAFKKIEEILSKSGDVFISSCYRLYPIENAYESFIIVPELKNRVNKVYSKFNNTIGLHIRRSDHVTSITYSSTDKFINVIENELNENQQTSFFLCTDDEITKNELISQFGEKIIINEVSSFDRNNQDAMKDAVVDLYCLSKTKRVYGSHHSSFSQTAAKIGQVKEITAR